jgi:predicted DNA-binding protein (MmcQ/YjbR family)
MTSDMEPLDQLRAICLELPEAVETGGVGNPSFKVRDKIFAMRHQHNGRWSMWCKAPPGVQEALVAADSARFFVPPYVGHHGWVGVYLDVALDWDEIGDLVDDSYRMTAPKRLSRLLGDSDGRRDDRS